MSKPKKKLKDISRFPKVTNGYEGLFKKEGEGMIKNIITQITKKIGELGAGR